MSEPYLIALKGRLLSKTTVLEDGCWYCFAGGEESRYGSIWYRGQNINNHVASWLVHKGPVPEGRIICHSCDYKRCINPEHLFDGTNADNSADMVAKGRQDSRRGELNQCAFLSEDNVREIKYFLEHSGMVQREIAEHFGVTQVTISQINTGKRWPHVK